MGQNRDIRLRTCLHASSSYLHRQPRPQQPQPQMDSPDSDVLPNGYRRTEFDRACALREAQQLTESQSSCVASGDRVPSMTARPRKKQRAVKDSAAASGDLLAEGYDPTKFVKQGVAIKVPKVGAGYRESPTADDQWEDAMAYFSWTSTGSEKPEVRVTLQFTSLKLAVNMHIQQKKLVDQFDSLLDGTTSGDLHKLAEQMRDNIVAFEGCGAEQCLLLGLDTFPDGGPDGLDGWYLAFKEISSDKRNDEEFRSEYLSEQSLSTLVSILPDYYVRDYKKWLEELQPACSICLVPKGHNDEFTFVMSCPQGHTLCSNCYKQCYQTADANSKDIECPTCKNKLPLRPFSRLSGVQKHMFDIYVINERILKRPELKRFFHLAGTFLTYEATQTLNQIFADQDGGTFGPEELQIMCDRLQFFTEIQRDPLSALGEWLFSYQCVRSTHFYDEETMVTRHMERVSFRTIHPTQNVSITKSHCEVPVVLPFSKPKLKCLKAQVLGVSGESTFGCERNDNFPFKMCRNCRFSCSQSYPPVVFSFRLRSIDESKNEWAVDYDLSDPTIVKKNLKHRNSPQTFQMTSALSD